MITLILLGSTLIFSNLSAEILEQAQKNYYLISTAISGAVGTAFICRLALYMAMGQGGSKYAKLFRETLEYYALTVSFPFLLSTIIDTANSVAQAMVPKMDAVSKASLERELAFPGILSSIMLKLKWWGISLGLLLSHIAHGTHVGLIYILYGLAPIFIFSHTMFNFTLAFPVLLGFVTVLSLWPVAASICSIMGDGIFHLAQANSGDMKSVLVLFAAYVGISILNLVIPFLLFFLASGHGPGSSFRLLKGLGGKAWNNTTALATESLNTMKALPQLPSRVAQEWSGFKTISQNKIERGTHAWKNLKGGTKAGISHLIGSNPTHHFSGLGMREFPNQLASGVRAFSAFQAIQAPGQNNSHQTYFAQMQRMAYSQGSYPGLTSRNSSAIEEDQAAAPSHMPMGAYQKAQGNRLDSNKTKVESRSNSMFMSSSGSKPIVARKIKDTLEIHNKRLNPTLTKEKKEK